jgi:cobyrinic acid a,c-diamide synthase
VKALCISAISSNQGKAILTSALLYHFRQSARGFKIGPDYIDPQFHEFITNTPSINLDTFMMNEAQVKWLYDTYSDKDISICEGVMGFYDGMDKGSSAYDVSKLLNIPSIILLDASASYITVAAVLKGLKVFREDNTIKGVVLNNISSRGHYELVKNAILDEFDDMEVLGWIKKDLPSLSNTHLGLDLKDISKIKEIAKEVLEHIDIAKIEALAKYEKIERKDKYPFKRYEKIDKKLAIIKDENFSFIYQDNIEFLKEFFKEVIFINPTLNEIIPKDSDVVYIPGGYVEDDKHYNNIKNSSKFRDSLIQHSKSKYIYAECAGLLYLGKCVDNKTMSGILDIDFELQKRFTRMGYYHSSNGTKGHSFHYTKPINPPLGVDILSKSENVDGEYGAWQKNKVYGTYLHSMFRDQFDILGKNFGII